MDYKSIIDYLTNFIDQDEMPIDSLKELGLDFGPAYDLIDAWFNINAIDRMNLSDSDILKLVKKAAENEK